MTEPFSPEEIDRLRAMNARRTEEYVSHGELRTIFDHDTVKRLLDVAADSNMQRKMLEQIADLLCDGDENVVRAARRVVEKYGRLRDAATAVVGALDVGVVLSSYRETLRAALASDPKSAPTEPSASISEPTSHVATHANTNDGRPASWGAEPTEGEPG